MKTVTILNSKKLCNYFGRPWR